MLIAKTKPVGIDVPIQQLQTFIHEQLVEKWELDDTDYKCHGRCYKNKTDDGYIAEVYKGGNEAGKKDYEEVYWNDRLTAISFFGISDNIDTEIQNTVNIHLVFFVNIKKLKPAIAHRADEEVRQDVQRLIGSNLFGFQFASIDLWLENVLKEYPGSRRSDGLKAVDMHPIHCFRFNFSLSYDSNIIC